MTAKVMMLVICWIAQGGELQEAWRVERQSTAKDCLTMTQVFAQGGKAAAITVRCTPIKDEDRP